MTGNIGRREFMRLVAGGTAAALIQGGAPAQESRRHRPNVVLLTADDLDYHTLGVTGCRIPGITPCLDRLASEGLRFTHAHVATAVCQPCRQSMMTGRYPHNIGATGFEPISRQVPTLQERLHEAGYLNGILAKVGHLAPREKFCWDTVVQGKALAMGRSPERFYEAAVSFFRKVKAAGKPFFLMANSQDPHRPFAGSRGEKRRRERRKLPFPEVDKRFRPEEVDLPPFLPDIPRVRREVAQYFASVHRCDKALGEVLQALRESGLEDNTLVMFISDHGMAFPFAKTNCYRASTRTPWMVRWPGVTEAGRVDSEHMVCGVDFTPTILAACGLEPMRETDGRSFLPLLSGRKQKGRDEVFTAFYKTSARKEYPMRSVQDRRFGYIYNAWADGKTVFKNESQSGLTFSAMRAAAKKDEKIAARVKLFLHRVPEELYDYQKDPGAQVNLIARADHRKTAARLRRSMAGSMAAVSDPLLTRFRREVLAGG